MSRKFLVPIALPADPVNPLEAATKQYVDAKVVGGSGLTQAQADALYVNVTGDTMTGALIINNDTSTGQSNLTLGPVSGQAGTEGGQLNFSGTSGYPNQLYLDRYQNQFRFVYNGGTVGQLDSTGLLTTSGAHNIGGNQLTFTGYGGGWYMSDSTWIRTVGDKNIYTGGGSIGTTQLGIGTNGGFTSGYGITIAPAAAISFQAANPTISAPSYIQMPGGLYVSGGTLYSQAIIYARGNISNDQTTLTLSTRTQVSIARDAGNFGTQNLMIVSPSGNETGFCMWNQAGGIAPLCRAYQTFGERFDFLNSPNSAYTTICAAAFSVQSALRTKQDISPARDIELLASISRVRTQRYLPVIRPQTLRKSERFVDLDRRWQAHGRSPLTATKPEHYEAHDHDCAIDPCPPICPIALNDHERFGLIAEDLHKATPEVVWLDEDGLPGGYDVDQIAALAFGGVGALTRLIVQLHERIEQLENA